MKPVKNVIAQVEVSRCFLLFFTAVLIFVVIFSSCDIDTSLPKTLKFIGLDEKYQVVFDVCLTEEKIPTGETEITIANWPPAISSKELIAEISNGTAVIDLYEYKYKNYNDQDNIISKKRWSGSGAYFVNIALRDGNHVTNFVSKEKFLITEAVTEIVFESNFEHMWGLIF